MQNVLTANRRALGAALSALAALGLATGAHAQTTVTITADPANNGITAGDYSSPSSSGTSLNTPGQSPYYVGSVYQQNQDDAIIVPFQLPAGDVITAASFTSMLTGRNPYNGVTPFSVDVSGLNRTSASPTVLASDYEAAAGFTDAGYFTTADGYVQRSYSGADLLAFLNTQEAAAPGQYVFFRLKSSTSAATPTASANYYQIETQTAAGNASAPTLRLTVVPAPAPEPSQVASLGLGALSLAGLALKSRKRRAA